VAPLGALLPALVADSTVAEPLLLDKLQDARKHPSGDVEAASRAANLTVALLATSAASEAWSMLSGVPDRTVRTQVIHRLGAAGVDPLKLIERLTVEQDANVLIAMLLGLGEYPSNLMDSRRRSLAGEMVQAIFTEHSHPGVHSAAEWLLSTWNLELPELKPKVNLAAESGLSSPGWLTNGVGDTLAAFPGPIEFTMGADPDKDLESFPEEAFHLRQIPRSFAIGTREVSVELYQRFCKELNRPCSYPKNIAPETTCPIVDVRWYDAVRYCRWLSETEGVPAEEMCYPSIEELDRLQEEGVDGRAIDAAFPTDLLNRTGYRLPTAAEWEYASRALTETSRPTGHDVTLLPRYAWFLQNSQQRVWPVGSLKPNDLGLFDALGNAMELCHNSYLPELPAALPDGAIVDGDDDRESLERELRDGSWESPAMQVRVSARRSVPPRARFHHNGFRIARTLRAADE
jgi:hypothetical protein